MVKALSTSKWKWTWRFLLLACAAVVALVLVAVIGSLIDSDSSTGEPAIVFILEFFGVVGLGVGIIGAVVSSVLTLLRHHSPPAKPVA